MLGTTQANKQTLATSASTQANGESGVLCTDTGKAANWGSLVIFVFFANDATRDGPAVELHLAVGIGGVSGGSTGLRHCATISPRHCWTFVILAQEGCGDQAEEAFTNATRKQLQHPTGIVPGTQLTNAVG